MRLAVISERRARADPRRVVGRADRDRRRVRRPRLDRPRAARPAATTSLRAAPARRRRSRRRRGGTGAPAPRRGARARRRASGSSTASILFATTICGLAASAGSNSCSSRRSTSRSVAGSRPVSLDTSTRCTSTLVRSRWRRNWWPSPWPRCAPSISPGTSASDEAAIAAQADDAEVRRERGERIGGDLRPRGRHARDQRRLAGVGEADQADVGEQLHLEPQILDLARQARLHAARRAVGGGGELRVAHAAAAALGDQDALSLHREVREQLPRVFGVAGLFVDERADRHREVEVGAAVARAVRSHRRARRARR